MYPYVRRLNLKITRPCARDYLPATEHILQGVLINLQNFSVLINLSLTIRAHASLRLEGL